MPIAFSCHSCGRGLRVKDELVGSQIYCPDCKSILDVPSPERKRPQDHDEIPLAEVAPPAEPDAYSARAEQPPPKPPPPAEDDDDDDDWEEPPRRPVVAPPASLGSKLPTILGGVGMLIGCAAFVVIGLVTGFWVVKAIVVLGIAGVVMLFKGLFGSGD